MSQKQKTIYYSFECGCQSKKRKRTDHGYVCPKHATKIVSKTIECIKCHKHLTVGPRATAKYCDECRYEIKKEKTRESNRFCKAGRAKAAKLRPKPVNVVVKKIKFKPKKKKFDQARRGECKFGTYCVDRQIRTGKRFNCLGCTRFTPLELDPMDYVKTASPWDAA